MSDYAIQTQMLTKIRKGNPFILNQLARQATLLLAPLAGLLIGVAQSFFETRPDNWAFVVHRPLSRLAVFAGKSAAGLVLLYVSLALPCLLVAVWAGRPGNAATPFHFRSVLPLLADVLNSGCYYFAGMVLTLRKARWFGSRILPLGFAAFSSVAVLLIPEFRQAVLLSAACTSISALAAWGLFATGGASERGWSPRLALGLMIFAGALGVGLLVEGFVGAFHTVAAWNGLRLDREGNVLRVYWTLAGSERHSVIADADGRPLEKYQGIDVEDPAYAGHLIPFSNPVFDDRAVPWPYSVQSGAGGYRSLGPEVVRLRAVAGPNTAGGGHIVSTGGRDVAMPLAGAANVPSISVLDAMDRIIKLYDPLTHMLVGTVGPGGFSPAAEEPAERFPGTPLNLVFQANTHTLTFPSIVYWMELHQRRVRPLFTAEAGDPVISACELSPQSTPRVFILTQHALRVLKPSGEPILAVPFNLDRSNHFFQFASLPSNNHLVVLAQPVQELAAPSRQVLEYSLDGTLVRRTPLPPVANDVSARTWQRTAAMGAVWPPALVPLYVAGNLDAVFETDYRQCWSSFLRSLLVSSLLCGVVAIPLSRRLGFGVGATAAWSTLNLLLGPAGLVVMLSLYEWPARELCTNCGRIRFVGRRECPHCVAALPPPARDGREIFEPLDAFGPAT